MRHAKQSRRLSMKSGQRTALLRNMTASLVEHGRVKTTLARAKTLKPYVEKIVTKLKDPTVANIRYVRKKIPTRGRVTMQTLLNDVAPAFKERPGGYLRILKLARPRVGDCADMAFLEWVEEKLVKAYQDPEEVAEATEAKKTTATKKKSAAKATAAPKTKSSKPAASKAKAAKAVTSTKKTSKSSKV